MGAAVGPAVGSLLPVCPRNPSVPSAPAQILTLWPKRPQFLSRGWSRLGRGLGT